jgi:hypothetical protein
LFFGARDGHVSPFSGLARWGGGFRRGFLRLGGTGVGACFPRATGIGEIRLSFCRFWVVASVLWLLFQSTFVIFGHFGIVGWLFARSVSLLCAIVLYCLEGLHVRSL